jgi:hypothetical protein
VNKLSDGDPNFTPRLAEKFLTWTLNVLTCIFAFVTPTLHCASWAPFVRAMFTLAMASALVSTIGAMLLHLVIRN